MVQSSVHMMSAQTHHTCLVAIAYVMQKTPHVFPIIGGRKVEHLHANIAALDVSLTDEHIKKIEASSPFDKGMMYTLFVRRACSPGFRTLFLTATLTLPYRVMGRSMGPSIAMRVTSTVGHLRLLFVPREIRRLSR